MDMALDLDIMPHSDLKRQTSGYDDFVEALDDALKAVRSAERHDTPHRPDVSSATTLCGDTSCDDLFTRPDGAGIFRSHALDDPEEEKGNPEGFRTGTPPFMAITILGRGDGRPHRETHDFHGVYFTLFLHFITFPPPRGTSLHSQRDPPKMEPWPRRVMEWAQLSSHHTLDGMAGAKRLFFEDLVRLRRFLNEHAPAWQHGRWMELHDTLYLVLWQKIEQVVHPMDRGRSVPVASRDRLYVDPNTLIDALSRFL